MRIEVMDIPFDNVTMNEALDAADRLMARSGATYGVTPNAEIVYEALEDEALRQIICRADLVLPDGAGVVLAAKLLKTPLKEKVAGIDFARRLMERHREDGTTFFFLGSKPGVAEKAAENMRKDYPGIQIVGTRDGYFQDEADVIREINEKKPDVLFVCLGFPKQEKFMYDHREALQVGLMLGLGGSLDGFAGNVKRAPEWMIRCSLEWLYRLIQEPSRFGRMLRLPKFLWRVMLRRMKG